MKKFLVLYRAPLEAYAQAMTSTPEQQQAGMKLWMEWATREKGAIVDMGAPLGKGVQVRSSGAEDVRNDLGGYSILQAESKEALARSLEGHPHFHMSGGFIEAVEIMPIPGM
ncbi:MAG: hypothetical protein U1F43_32470 [Myxococcota bacterium]